MSDDGPPNLANDLRKIEVQFVTRLALLGFATLVGPLIGAAVVDWPSGSHSIRSCCYGKVVTVRPAGKNGCRLEWGVRVNIQHP